jgi:hypothetical protein
MGQENPGSAIKATQGRDATGEESHGLWWAEASIWTDRMVSALDNSLPRRRPGEGRGRVAGSRSAVEGRLYPCGGCRPEELPPGQARLHVSDHPARPADGAGGRFDHRWPGSGTDRPLSAPGDHDGNSVLAANGRDAPRLRGGRLQGAVLSPLLANLYLHPLDLLMEQSGYRMVRYADDFVILCASEAQAAAALGQVTAWGQAVTQRRHHAIRPDRSFRPPQTVRLLTGGVSRLCSLDGTVGILLPHTRPLTSSFLPLAIHEQARHAIPPKQVC